MRLVACLANTRPCIRVCMCICMCARVHACMLVYKQSVYLFHSCLLEHSGRFDLWHSLEVFTYSLLCLLPQHDLPQRLFSRLLTSTSVPHETKQRPEACERKHTSCDFLGLSYLACSKLFQFHVFACIFHDSPFLIE